MITGLPAYWLSDTCLPGWPSAVSVNPAAAGWFSGAAEPLVATLTTITAAANSATTAEITLCRPISWAARATGCRAAPGPFIVWHSLARGPSPAPAGRCRRRNRRRRRRMPAPTVPALTVPALTAPTVPAPTGMPASVPKPVPRPALPAGRAGSRGRRGQRQLELAALAKLAVDGDVAAVRVGDRADQGQPEAGSPRLPVVAGAGIAVVNLSGAEPVEDERYLVLRYAAAGVRDDDPGRRPRVAPDHGQLDDVIAPGMPDRVLDQRVERQTEPFPVGAHRDGVQLPDPQVPVDGGPPAPDMLGDQLVKRHVNRGAGTRDRRRRR